MTTVPTAVRLPADLVRRYDDLARATGRSRTFYVTEALEEAIQKLEFEYGILGKIEAYRAGRLDTVTLDEVEASLGLAD